MILLTLKDYSLEEISKTITSLLYNKALQHIQENQFQPWEGGEGKISSQYVYSLIELAKIALKEGKPLAAIDYLKASLSLSWKPWRRQIAES